MQPMVEHKEDKPKAAQAIRLVGREAEVGIVNSALLRLKGGQSGCIVFSGREGLGKTTLLNYCSIEAKTQELLVYSATTNESAAGNPYQPLFSALGLSFDSTGEIVHSSITHATAKEFGMESMVKVVNIVNAITTIIPNPIGVALGLGDLAIRLHRFNRRQHRAREENAGGSLVNQNFQAIHHILLDLYEEHRKARPIVLIIDELQYAGETTFKLLDALVTPSFPILLLLGLSNNNTALPKLLRKLVERIHGEIVDLAPISYDDTLALIDRYIADPNNAAIARTILASRSAIANFCSGFPGVLEDSIAYLLQGGDAALFSANRDTADDMERGAKLAEALTTKYLKALDPDLYNLLECAAVAGRRFPFEVMTSETMRSYQGLTTNRRSVLKQLAELAVRKQVVSVEPSNRQLLAFNSAYIYNTLLRNLPPPLLRADHLEIARAWEQLASEQGNVERVASELARHFYAAEHYAPASRYYLAAASQLFSQSAYAEASDAYGMALACLDQMTTGAENMAIRREVLTSRSLAYEYLGQNKQAIAALEAALSLVGVVSDGEARDIADQAMVLAQPRQHQADLLGHLGWLYFKTGDYGKAAACFDSCEQLYKAAGDIGGMVRIGIYRGGMHSQQHSYAQALKELSACLEQYRQRGITAVALISGKLSAAQLAEAEGIDRLYLELGLVYNRMRRLDEAAQYLHVALKLAEAQHDRNSVVQGKHYLGQCLSLQGKEDAIQYLAEAREEAREQLKDRYLAASIGTTLAYAYQGLGQVGRAVQAFRELIPELEGLGDRYGLGAAYGGLGALYARMWRFDVALDYLRRDLEVVDAEEHPTPGLVSKLSNQIADLERLSGNLEQAWVDARISRAAADLSDTAAREHNEGFAALTEAQLHADVGEIAAAQQALAEAQAKLADLTDEQGGITVVAARLARLGHDWQTAAKLLTAILPTLWPHGDLYNAALAGLELTRLYRDLGDPATAHKWAGWTMLRAQALDNQSLAQLAAHEASISRSSGLVQPQPDSTARWLACTALADQLLGLKQRLLQVRADQARPAGAAI